MGLHFKRKQIRAEIRQKLRTYRSGGAFDNYLEKSKSLLALLELHLIIKDYEDIAKGFKSKWYLISTIFQPFIGVLNILKGLGKIILMPFFYAFNILYHAYNYKFGHTNKETFDSYHETILADLSFTVPEGAAQILHGLLQILKTPITWFIELPIRISKLVRDGWVPFAKNQGASELIKEATSLINEPAAKQFDMAKILCLLEEKYSKAADNSQISYDKISEFRENSPNFIKGLTPETNHKMRFGMFSGYKLKCVKDVVDLEATLTPDLRNAAKSLLGVM